MGTRKSLEANATTTEANAPFLCKEIILIANDGTDDITFNFDNETDGEDAFTLKPGEVLTSMPITCKGTVYYKSASGTQAFRLWGGG